MVWYLQGFLGLFYGPETRFMEVGLLVLLNIYTMFTLVIQIKPFRYSYLQSERDRILKYLMNI